MSESPKSIIDSKSQCLVIQEIPLSLSDEKLKNILLKTYEKAIEDANSFKYYKYYDILLSIFLSLLVPLLSSSFNAIGSISAECVTKIVWGICILCGLCGFVFMLIASKQNMKNDTKKRDDAIEKIFIDHFKQ